MSITVKLETITPEKAVAYLDMANSKQRHYRPQYAQYLAGQMAAGNWRVNGETLKFDESGHFIDGQHRLHGVYIAKKPIEFLVARGVPDDVFDSIDVGKKRSVADVLGMLGEKQSTLLSAVVCIMPTLREVINHECSPSKLSSGYRLSAIEAQKFLQSWPNIRKSTDIAARYYTRIVPAAMTASVHWLYGQNALADQFVVGMKDGLHPTYRDQQALHMFREVMITNKMSHAKLRRPAILALAIKAMNAAMRSEKITKLEWQRDEQFPQPILKA